MKLTMRTVFELYDLDGQKSFTFSRKEAKAAFKKGFEVIEQKIIRYRESRKRAVVTIVLKSW
jgi:hypothetical protein